MAEEPRRGQPVTARAVLLGAALLPFNALWLAQIEFVRYSDTPTIPQLFFHCVAGLLLLTLLNAPLARFAPRLAFDRGELLTIYVMQVIGSNLASHDQLAILWCGIAYVFGRATPENRWAEIVQPHLRQRLYVTDEDALNALFQGHSSVYEHGYWKVWLTPLAVWSLIALIIAGSLYCLATLLRRRWDEERLTYPLAEVPLAVSEPGLSLWRQPAYWAAFALAAGLQLLNLAHQIWPPVPGINLGVRNLTFTQPPWSYMGTVPICFYPFAFGLSFLLPTDLAFSCWFFFLLTRLERVVAGSFGHTSWDGFPYVNQQASGAFVGFGLLVVLSARRHLARTLRIACGREGGDRTEPLSYRLAWLGFLAGGFCLVGFAVPLGVRWTVAAAYFGLLLAIIIAVARIRAEVGLPSIELYQRGADDILRRAGGSLAFKPAELIFFRAFFWLNRTQRNYNLQHQLHGLRLASRTGLDLRSFGWPIMVATVLGIPIAFWSFLHVFYQVGLEGGKMTGPAGWAFGHDPWKHVTTMLLTPVPPDRGGTVAYLFGAGVTGLLVLLRTRFVWWNLHPAGWVVSNSFALLRLWVPLTLTWAVKASLLRYGGLRAYRAALPFFIGLVAGEFTAGLLRTLVDLAWELYLPSGAGIGGL